MATQTDSIQLGQGSDDILREDVASLLRNHAHHVSRFEQAGVIERGSAEKIIVEMYRAVHTALKQPHQPEEAIHIATDAAKKSLADLRRHRKSNIRKNKADELQSFVSSRIGVSWLQNFGLTQAEADAYLPEFERATAGLVQAFKDNAARTQAALKKPVYADSDKSRDPVTFYREEWADEIAAGTVTQALVRSVDPGLIKTMRQYCVRHDLDAATTLPPSGKSGRPLPDPVASALAEAEGRRRRQRKHYASKRQGS